MPTLFGSAIKRREDPRLITGAATYVDDVKLPGLTYAAILRSPYAHARITSVDVRAARQAPGVVAVYTGADIKDKIGRSPDMADALALTFAYPVNRVRGPGGWPLDVNTGFGGRLKPSSDYNPLDLARERQQKNTSDYDPLERRT